MQDKDKNNKHEHGNHGGKHANGSHSKHEEPVLKEQDKAAQDAKPEPGQEAQQVTPDDRDHHKEHGKHKGPTPEEFAAINDRYVRLMADFDNFRRRTARERSETILRATEDLLKDLLPVVDHLEMAMEAAKSGGTQSAVVDGFKMVGEQFITVLKSAGLTPFESVGKMFDPAKQETISHMPSETAPENQVVAEVRKGYMLGERLLRAARVVISSGKPDTVSSQDAGAEVEYEQKTEE